MDQLVEFKMNF